MPYFVYILECNDQTYYVGSTKNIDKRVHQHNHCKAGAHYTKLRRPVALKYHEEYETLLEARRREASLKRWPKQRKIQLLRHEQIK
jgi:putative endonuclease